MSNAALQIPVEVCATEMLTDSMDNLVDALQELSDRLAPALGPVAGLLVQPVLYDDALADAIQAEAAWADAIEGRVRELLARL